MVRKMGKTVFFMMGWAVVALSMVLSIAQADNILSGPRPGENNPLNMAHPYLFRDDELFLFAGYPTAQNRRDYFFTPTKDDLTSWSEIVLDDGVIVDSHPSGLRQMATASGRLNSLKSDAIVYAFFDKDGDLMLKKYETAENKWYGPFAWNNDPSVNSDRSLDVAVGDLDLTLDSNGHTHDEVIVARSFYLPYSYAGVNVCVFGANLQQIIAFETIQMDWEAGIVAVAIGDFDGDKQSEIAVGIAAIDKYERRIVVYKLTKGGGGFMLKWLSDTTFTQSTASSQCIKGKYNNAFDMTAGDFNNDGKDEIFMASSIGHCVLDSSLLDLSIFSFDEKAIPRVAWSKAYFNGGYFIPNGQLRVESGLFLFDPKTGWGLNRPQVALCHVTSNYYMGDFLGPPNSIHCRIYKIGTNLAASEAKTIELRSQQRLWYSSLDVITGNFIGHGQDGKEESPLMQLALSYTENNEDGYYDGLNKFHLTGYQKRHGIKVIVDPIHTASIRNVWESDFINYKLQDPEPVMLTAISAPDIDGNTYRLGFPIHIVVENLLGLDYVICEPPKHVDYLPVNKDNPNGPWDVIDVSALSGFNVEFIDSQTKSFQTKSTDTTAHKIGGGLEFGPTQNFVQQIMPGQWGLDLKVSYDYESSRAKWESNYKERTTAFSSRTEKDDFLAGKIQLIDIWRYPILGYDTGDPAYPQAYKEIFLPGPKYTFSGGGLDHADWYQPIHQNENLLSYPLISAKPYQNEMGSFNLPDGTEVQGPMNDMAVYDFSGTYQTLNIAWTSTSGSGSEKSYNHTFSENVELNVGYKFLFFNAGELTATFHNSNSWGNTKSEESYNTGSKGITIHVPSGEHQDAAYGFQPAVYVSNRGGFLKVAHAVNPLSSSKGNAWWRGQYGRKPDPSLNLPSRMKWNCKDWSSTGECYDEFWTLNEDHDRMEMRGFLMRESTPDPFSGEYTPLAGPPKDGDVVRLCARVYNYALFSPANNFHVLFEYIPIDQAADEIGSRVVIGKVSTNLAEIENSDPVHNPSMKEVCVNWDTTGLGQSQYTYRFYVTVDPDNEVKNELHEWKEADGAMCIHGNNEGYWPWGAGMPVLTPEVPGEEPATHDIFITKKSLCLLQNNKFTSGSASVQAGQKYKLRAQIHSTHDRSPFHYVVFSEGPPVEGNEFAVKMAGIIKGDSYVWADWTPKAPGIKQLYVHIAEHLGDTGVGNNFDSLFVKVQDFPIINPTPIPVTIDIKPGSKPNSINLKSNGTIPVAILSSAKFHAPRMVDRGSLSFGRTGEEESLAFCDHRGKDLNGDGLKDLICHFYTEDTGLECGDTLGVLKGETIDNKPIEGKDSVRIVPCKKQASHNPWKWSQGRNWHCP